ncbi:hypothetical protein F5887DRAFT_1073533 [Amanita rubescens]|nr:hypothetical protein F5887DRAFT_1073533 [Amanita rubescens]
MFKLSAKSTRHNTSTRTISFPPELYGHIIDFVFSQSDLFSLCLVCRDFYFDAKRALYRCVDLAHDHLLIQKWFTLIVSSPHLAHLVRSLTFGLVYAHLPTPSVRWLSVIERGLDALTELIELNVDLRASSSTTLPPSSTSIILGHPFRLRVFRNTMFDLARILPFLESQPDIVVWHQPAAKFCNLPPNFLPKLSRAGLPSWLVDELATRKLTELSTAVNAMGANAELAFLNTLTPFSLTLNRLCLQRQVFNVSLTLREFLLHLAERLPDLEHLSLWNHGELVSLFHPLHLCRALNPDLFLPPLLPSTPAAR